MTRFEIKDANDVKALLNDESIIITTSDLFAFYSLGHKTSVMESKRLTEDFLRKVDLSKDWYNYYPLYSNKNLTFNQINILMERFETERKDNFMLLFRLYAFLNISHELFTEKICVLLKNSSLREDSLEVYELTDILIEANRFNYEEYASYNERFSFVKSKLLEMLKKDN